MEERRDRKRKNDDDDGDSEDEFEVKEKVDVNDIEGLRKRQKASREERIQSILAGREDRKKYGRRENRSQGGTTNKAKAKKKAPAMIARGKANKKREKNKISKRAADKQFKGKFRK